MTWQGEEPPAAGALGPRPNLISGVRSEMKANPTDWGLRPAARYADRLVRGAGGAGGDADSPALAWRRAGLMDVTGRADGPGLVCPLALASAADGAMLALRHLAPAAALPLNGALLLGERARLMGLSRQGSTSANGSCRLLDSDDGRIICGKAARKG